MPRLALLLTLLLSSCMPFALPPSRLSLGSGPHTGSIQRREDLSLRATQVTGFRAGLNPLSLLDRASSRPLDLGAGYQVDFITGSERPTQPSDRRDSHDLAHGPYVEGAYYPLRGRVGEGTFVRFGGRTNLDLLFLEPTDRVGFGGAALLDLELVTDVNGPFVAAGQDGVLIGAQRGQWGLGLFAGGAYRSFHAASFGGLTAGVSVRLPLAAGVACCAWPGKKSSEQSEPVESKPRRHRATPHAGPPPKAPEQHRAKDPAPPEHRSKKNPEG